MKVSLLSITKHGESKIWKLRNRIEPEMACPQCGYNDDDARAAWGADGRGMNLVKVYSPTILKETTLTDLEYSCNKCECEWIIQIEEKNERS